MTTHNQMSKSTSNVNLKLDGKVYAEYKKIIKEKHLSITSFTESLVTEFLRDYVKMNKGGVK